jgi:hypothetical protein
VQHLRRLRLNLNGRSIWNQFGNYGSKFEDTSPWNKFASHPPVIVDPNGGFYGYFTASTFFGKRTTIQPLIDLANIGAEQGPEAARNALCDS